MSDQKWKSWQILLTKIQKVVKRKQFALPNGYSLIFKIKMFTENSYMKKLMYNFLKHQPSE